MNENLFLQRYVSMHVTSTLHPYLVYILFHQFMSTFSFFQNLMLAKILTSSANCKEYMYAATTLHITFYCYTEKHGE